MKTRNENTILELCNHIRRTAFDPHVYLRHGQMEKVYENGLAHRLRKKGFIVEQQKPVQIHDEDGAVLGNYIVDLLVEECLIVEIKACKTIVDGHIAPVLGYLHATHLHDALLLNFGSSKLQIRKFII
jgi:GxxExxY protein